MKLTIKAGATSNIFQIFVRDSSSTTGAGLTGLVFNSASLTAYYHKDTDTTATAITLVTMTVGTFTSSGFKEIDATNMPGWYQFCPPDAAVSSGKSCAFHLKGATNMAPLPIEVMLVAVDFQDTVRLGLTALPNVASGSAGAIPTTGTGSNQISVSSGQVILQSGTGTGQLDFTSGVVKANATQILGTAVSTPATAGVLDVNVKNMNNVAATSITTVNANVGTTQPLNFTGTGASALVKSDMVDIAGAAVSTSTAQIGVNAVNWAGGAIPAPNVTGVPKTDLVDWLGVAPLALSSQQVQAVVPSSTVVASVTGAVGSVTGNVGGNVVGSVASVTARVTANTDQLAGQTVTAAAGVTFPTSVASPTNITAGTITTVTNLTNAPTAGDFTATMKTSLNAATPSVTVSDKTGFSLSAAGVQAIWDALTSALTTVGSIGKLLAALPGSIWDVVLASHVTAGSTGFALNSASSSGDPWGTALPGAYGAGTAGFIVGTNVDATISSRTKPADTQAAVTTVTNLTNAPTAGDFTATMKTSLNAATPSVTLSASERNSIADAILKRDWTLVSGAAARSTLNALRFLRNKWSVSGTTLTVTTEDDASTAWTATITTDAAAIPITGSDPT